MFKKKQFQFSNIITETSDRNNHAQGYNNRIVLSLKLSITQQILLLS